MDTHDLKTIETSRECKRCGWVLPEEMTGYIGNCPQCMENIDAFIQDRESIPMTSAEAIEAAATARRRLTVT